jgi:hypothetical protein
MSDQPAFGTIAMSNRSTERRSCAVRYVKKCSLLATLTALAATSCSGADDDGATAAVSAASTHQTNQQTTVADTLDSSASTVVTTRTAPAAVTTETRRPVEAEASYVSTSFVTPFEVTLPDWVAPEPVTEKPNFVAWEGADVDRAIRFLVPGVVYPPGETAPVPVPDDYLAYLLAQSDHGAVFEDVIETTVDGRPATIVTATTPSDLSDTIGCTKENDLVTDCFGLLSDLILRIAVLDTDKGPLLIWVRDSRGANREPEHETFDAMLSSLHFRPDAAPTSVPDTTLPGGVDPRLPEGDYRTTKLTSDELIATGVNAGFARTDVESAVDAALPGFDGTLELGLRLADGAWRQYVIVNGGPAEIGWIGTYDIVDDDTVVATDVTGEDGSITFAYELDDDRLILDAVDCGPCDPVADMITTMLYETAPFTRQ